jgi:hypothetical protein
LAQNGKKRKSGARWISWLFGLAFLAAVVLFAAHRSEEVASLKLVGIPVAAGLAATLLFRGFSYGLPMGPGIILARRETRT